MRQTVKRDKHSEIVEQRTRKSATYRKTFGRTLHQIDLALLVREMREDAGLTQAELAKKVGTTQSVIARLEDAEYTGLAHNAGTHRCGLRDRPQAPRGEKTQFRPRGRAGLVPEQAIERLAGFLCKSLGSN